MLIDFSDLLQVIWIIIPVGMVNITFPRSMSSNLVTHIYNLFKL